jgi:hypothetical protein
MVFGQKSNSVPKEDYFEKNPMITLVKRSRHLEKRKKIKNQEICRRKKTTKNRFE